ncbi:MAG TPA: hypothetical protein VJB14_09160 [Planctomycetota bacterium]|nr:hypothetical protein [Planctomycetota bacterium]
MRLIAFATVLLLAPDLVPVAAAQEKRKKTTDPKVWKAEPDPKWAKKRAALVEQLTKG